MPTWFFDEWSGLGAAAAKAGLMYLVALLGLRVAHRRTLMQWSAIDFAAAVAIGAIVGRTAVASGQSFAVGVVALVSILAAHWLATVGRFKSWFASSSTIGSGSWSTTAGSVLTSCACPA